MKKHALALAVLAIPATALADGPTLYGKLNVTLDDVRSNNTGVPATSGSTWQLNSNASRLGVKGEADTNIEGLKGIYQAEFGLKADDGVTSSTNPSPFSQRNIFAGLKSRDFGTLRFGKIDTPLKDAQGKVQEFKDLAGDYTNLLAGETRASNLVYYTSPTIAEGLSLNAAISPAEGKDITNSDHDANTATNPQKGLATTRYYSVVWSKDALWAALAVSRDDSGSGALDGFTDTDSATAGTQAVANIKRAVVGYNAASFEVSGLFETAEDASGTTKSYNKHDEGWVLAGAYKNGPWKLKAGYGANKAEISGDRKTLASLGADYALSKSTTLLAYYTDVKTDKATGTDTGLGTLGIGIDQKF